MLDVEAPALVAGGAVHGSVRVRAGGAPVNAAFAARSLGASAAVVGRVGADAAGRLIRDELETAGIEGWLVEDRDLPTGTFLEAGDAVAADRGASAALAAKTRRNGSRRASCWSLRTRRRAWRGWSSSGRMRSG